MEKEKLKLEPLQGSVVALHAVYKPSNEPLIGGALLGETKMTKEKINELKAKAFDIIMKSNALFLDEDGNVKFYHADCYWCEHSAYLHLKGITEKEHSFLSLVMSEDYELAEGELE